MRCEEVNPEKNFTQLVYKVPLLFLVGSFVTTGVLVKEGIAGGGEERRTERMIDRERLTSSS